MKRVLGWLLHANGWPAMVLVLGLSWTGCLLYLWQALVADRWPTSLLLI